MNPYMQQPMMGQMDPYQQQMNPYMQQQPMMGQMNPMMQPQMSPYMQQPMMMQNPAMSIPGFNQIKIGCGIDSNEFAAITQIAYMNLQQGMGVPIATNISRQIKAQLGGEWFTFVSIVGDKAYNFALTCVSGGDFLAFSINETLFQICRLRQMF